jgi:hypothetical protein
MLQSLRISYRRAELTQLVECQLPKLDVAGSIPVLRSTFAPGPSVAFPVLRSVPRDRLPALFAGCRTEGTCGAMTATTDTRSRSAIRSARRLRREEKTIAAMIGLFCRGHHAGAPRAAADGPDAALCGECGALLAYARLRLTHCRFGERKPTCARCTVHCYRAERRDQVRRVMRYSGPRMTTRHPLLALAHLLDHRHTPRIPAQP